MSGGALDYVYSKVEDAAEEIHTYSMTQKKPLFEAFSSHLVLVAEALQHCEWVMSNDYGEDGADDAIEKALGDAKARELESVVEQLNRLLGKAQEIIGKAGKA